MKRDLDLIRLLLLDFEKLRLNDCIDPSRLELPPWSEDEIIYNCFRMRESGLIAAADLSSGSGKNILVMSLTSAGHDYLDAVRDASIWGKVKSRLALEGEAGGIEIAKALALSLLMRKLGMKD